MAHDDSVLQDLIDFCRETKPTPWVRGGRIPTPCPLACRKSRLSGAEGGGVPPPFVVSGSVFDVRDVIG